MDQSRFQAYWQSALCRLLDYQRAAGLMSLRPFGFTSQTVLTKQGQVHCVSRGKAGIKPTWIFIHGLTSAAAEWARLLRHMGPSCQRILAIDLLGHGQSTPAPGTEVTLDSLMEAAAEALKSQLAKNETCVLVANSLGALVAIDFVLRRQATISGLILISPAGAPLTEEEQQVIANLFEIEGRDQAAQFADAFFASGLPPGYRQLVIYALWAHFNRPELRSLMKSLRGVQPFSPEDLAGMPPTYLMWGKKDRILPASSASYFRSHLPKARLQVATPEGFGHSPFLEQPRAVSKLLLEWGRARLAVLEA